MVLYIFAALCSIADVGLLFASLFGQAWWDLGRGSFGFLRLCNLQNSSDSESCGFRESLFKFEDGFKDNDTIVILHIVATAAMLIVMLLLHVGICRYSAMDVEYLYCVYGTADFLSFCSMSAAIAELVLVMLKFERDRNFSTFEKGWSIYCFFIAVGFLGLTQILLSIILCLPLKDNSSSPSQNFIREPYVSNSRQNQPWSSLEMQQGSMNMSYQEQKY